MGDGNEKAGAWLFSEEGDEGEEESQSKRAGGRSEREGGNSRAEALGGGGVAVEEETVRGSGRMQDDGERERVRRSERGRGG